MCLVVEAISGGYNDGNTAKIIINNTPVKISRNIHNNYRGLHIVVINPINGFIVTA